MKRSLALALLLTLGVSSAALAANPFSDVPAGHWAYDSIAKLAAAGVVDGYGDNTYRGDRLMTRYEMAQIVAKAMAKGANVDRLASEFADELDSLGVRVAKLEKKADNVKITGQVRYSYANNDTEDDGYRTHNGKSSTSPYEHQLRSRIWMTGEVNDNWHYVGMLQNIQNFANNTGDETTNFQRAYLEGRLGGTKVTAGRFDHTLPVPELYDSRFDGIKVAYGKKVRVGAYYGRPTDQLTEDEEHNNWGYNYNKAWGVNAAGDLGHFTLSAGYDKFTNSDGFYVNNIHYDTADDGVWNVGALYNFGSTASLGAVYMKSDMDYQDLSNKGIVVTGTLYGAKADKPGSWGLVAKYYNQGIGTAISHTMNSSGWADFVGEGFQGWMAGGYYTVAKNMVAGIEYYDLKGKETDNKDKTLWGQMLVTF